jgi:hypothetical protein
VGGEGDVPAVSTCFEHGVCVVCAIATFVAIVLCAIATALFRTYLSQVKDEYEQAEPAAAPFSHGESLHLIYT